MRAAGQGPEEGAAALVGADSSPLVALAAQAEAEAGWATEGGARPLVTTALLGNASAPQQPYTLPDGSALAIDVDY